VRRFCQTTPAPTRCRRRIGSVCRRPPQHARGQEKGHEKAYGTWWFRRLDRTLASPPFQPCERPRGIGGRRGASLGRPPKWGKMGSRLHKVTGVNQRQQHAISQVGPASVQIHTCPPKLLCLGRLCRPKLPPRGSAFRISSTVRSGVTSCSLHQKCGSAAACLQPCSRSNKKTRPDLRRDPNGSMFPEIREGGR
jgi:hypothetical protein